MDPQQQRWRGSIQLLLGLGLTILFFYMMAPFVLSLMLGAVTAAIVYPVFQKLRRKLPTWLAAMLVTLGVALGIIAPVFNIIYIGAFKLKELLGGLNLLNDRKTVEGIIHHPALNKLVGAISRTFPVDREWVRDQSISILSEIIQKLSGILGSALKEMPGLFLSFGVVILSLYFFLTDGAKFLRFLSRLSPLRRERSLELWSAFESSCRGVVLGLLLSAVVQGLIMFVFFLIVGLPNAFLVGFVSVIAGLIPIVGNAPFWIGATIYLISKGSIGLAVVMIIGGICISLSDNLVKVLVMKGHGEMHPLLALVSVFGAVNLVGPMGIFLGPIIAAVFVSFLKIISMEIDRERAAGAPDSTV